MGTIFNTMKTILGTIKSAWDNNWGGIQDKVKLVFEVIETVIRTVLGVIEGLIQVFSGVITGDWTKVWEGVKNY